jgi:hypothetical protein
MDDPVAQGISRRLFPFALAKTRAAELREGIQQEDGEEKEKDC